jgi:ribosomal protein L11 methyltransferase
VVVCRSVVQLVVDAADAELAADALWQGEPSAVSTAELPDGRVRLTADVAAPEQIPARWEVEHLAVDSDEYLDAWRAWAQPVVVADRVVLQPAWLPVADVQPGSTIVRLDPGRTFGSGSHPSTQLAIELVLTLPLEQSMRHVLDLGCGSGVLGIAVVLLGRDAATASTGGVERVEAVDVDPAAVLATQVNARLNAVGDVIEASTTPLLDLGGRFDLVLANIGAGVLRDLATPIGRRVAPSGSLILSGILDDQVDDVLSAYSAWTERGRTARDGWTALLLDRRR